MQRPRMSRAAARLLPALVLAAAWGLLSAQPAGAHAGLVRSEPSSGKQLSRSPTRLLLVFNEPVDARQTTVKLLTGAGAAIAAGTPEASGDGLRLTVSLPKLGQGAYVVSWRTVSADSHPVQGALTFAVSLPGAPAAPQPALDKAVADAVAAERGSPMVGGLFVATRVLATVALLTLLGGAAFLAFTRLPSASREARRLDWRARQILWSAWSVGLAATLAGLLLQGPYTTARPLSGALDPELLAQVLSSRFGQTWGARVLLLLLAVPLLRAARPAEGGGRLSWDERVSAVLLAAGVLLTPGLTGHASVGDGSVLARVGIGVHFAAVAVWFGGLVLLVASVLPGGSVRMREAVPRFSAVAFGAMVFIVASGAFLASREVDSVQALVGTTYGRLLVLKVVAFMVLIAVASVSREWVRDRLVAASPVAARPLGPGAARADPALASVTVLRRFVLAEVAIAIVILSVTMLLANTAPARSQPAPAPPAAVEGG